jgi:hypothetical protein
MAASALGPQGCVGAQVAMSCCLVGETVARWNRAMATKRTTSSPTTADA